MGYDDDQARLMGQADQLIAWARTVGAAVGEFYQELTQRGVPADFAVTLTVRYFERLTTTTASSGDLPPV